MTRQYRNFDATKLAPVARIDWELIIEQDDCADRPDERQDGFWPSLKKDDAGFIGDGKTRADLNEATRKANERMQGWKDGTWTYIGVIARAHIMLPIGGGSWTTYTFDSPGLWGIESDAGDYLKEVFADEKAQVLEHLKALGAAIADGTAIQNDR